MPPRFEGLRRLPRPKAFALIIAHSNLIRQWVLKQSIPRRIGLGVAVYLMLALTAYAAFGGNACAVTVNGKVIAIAASENSARGALSELIKWKTSQAGRPVFVMEKVSYHGIRVVQADLLDPETLKNKLNEALTFKVKATAILVNGEPKVFLKQKEDGEKLLAWLKTIYPVEANDQIGFKENIELAEAPADVGNILDLEAAKKLVLLGTNKVEQYKVKNGDTLWDIAHSVKIDVSQIILSNPGMDPDHLSLGQILNLSREAPLITVVATRQVTQDEEIPYQVEIRKDDKLLMGEKKVITKGVPGERTVTYRITRENGLETDRQVLDQNILQEATTEVVDKGSITMVASRGGSVRLGWPASGAIVSPFGMRWGRMHEGVDIGASYGSSVVAAAGGTVIEAGWEGGYGKNVRISHGGGLVTRYAHLSTISVSDGQSVNRGQLIGLVGATGDATGPHLHFEVIINGQTRNPVNYLP